MSDTVRGGMVLKVIPILALLSWIAAVALAVVRLNPWRPGSEAMVMYGNTAPDWLVMALMAVSLILAGVGLWRRQMPWAYVAGGAIVPLGTGAKGLVGSGILEGDLLPLLGFAMAVFLFIEYQTALPRFRLIVESTQGLEGGESRQAARFLARYLIGSVVLAGVYLIALAGWVQYAVPGLAGTFSERVADGLENRTALGIITFTGLLLLLAFSIRVLYDGIQGVRESEDEEEDASDITDLDRVSIRSEIQS